MIILIVYIIYLLKQWEEIRNKNLISPIEIAASPSISGQVDEMELTTKNGQDIYELTSKKKSKLLGIIPVKKSNQYKVDAQTNSILEEKRPFWSVLAIE